MDDREEKIWRLFKAVIDGSHKARTKIVRELGRSLEHPVSVKTLNEMAIGRTRVPAAWIADVCDVTDNDDLARAVLPERLRAALAIGERVIEASGSLRRAQAELAKLEASGSQKRNKVK